MNNQPTITEEKVVLTIIRKARPMSVVKMKVKDLDKSKCSFMFLSHQFDENSEVYVKCDEQGNLSLHGNRYTLLSIDKHELVKA